LSDLSANKKSNLPVQSSLTIILIAMWFGLATGIIEGVIFIISQMLGQMVSVTHEILWIAPLSDLLVFLLAGIALAIASLIIPRLPAIDLAVGLFAFLAILAWTLATFFEDLANYAILLLTLGLTITFIRFYRKRATALIIFWRKSLPWLAASALLLFAIIQGGSWLRERIQLSQLATPTSDSPNFLVIIVDALRADRLGSYGYHRETSPNIDRLAQEGVVFENAISPSAYTLPSHASIMTGVPPSQNGVEWYAFNALRNYPGSTIAEALQKRGYRTAAFSANTFWFTREQGFGRGFIHFEDYFQSAADMFFRTIYGRIIDKVVLRTLGFEDIPARLRASDINRHLLQWISKDSDNPYFIFINYLDVHDPYMPLQPYRSKFSTQKEPGGVLNFRIGKDTPDLTPEQAQGESDAYDGTIAYVDEQLSQLISELGSRGLLENTIVIITSDHGEAFGEHGMYLHGNSLYREEIHVPLIVWSPGRIPQGMRIDQPVPIAALPSTLMDLSQPSEASSFPGPPLNWFWEGHVPNIAQSSPVSEIAMRDWRSEAAPVTYGWIKSIVDEKWHYIKYEKLPPSLFSWQDDPLEADNLAGQPEMQTLLGNLNQQLLNFLGVNETTGINPP